MDTHQQPSPSMAPQDEVLAVRRALARLVQSRQLTAARAEQFERALAQGLAQTRADRILQRRVLDAVLVAVDRQTIAPGDIVDLGDDRVAVHLSGLLDVLHQGGALADLNHAQLRNILGAAAGDPATGVVGYQVRATFAPGDRRRALVLDLASLRAALGRNPVPPR